MGKPFVFQPEGNGEQEPRFVCVCVVVVVFNRRGGGLAAPARPVFQQVVVSGDEGLTTQRSLPVVIAFNEVT